ncbi:hypothetical protein FRB90_001843, partial [Tulasnella sp. 427]
MERSTNTARRSDVVPIHQLPFELLLYVFQQSFRSYRTNKQYYREIFRLSRVCKHWNLVIQASPQLWSKVTGYATVAALSNILELGSSYPIEVECTVRRYNRSQPSRQQVLHFFKTVGYTANRWRSLALELGWSPVIDVIRSILQLEAPDLQILILKDEEPRLDFSQVELFRGTSPKLKSVTVGGVYFRWSQPAFKGLETLCLERLKLDSIEILLDMLRDCPQLRSLDVKRCDFLAYPSREIPQVSLPYLADLSLDFSVNFMGPTLNRVLQHIQAPPHCALHIDLAHARDRMEVIKVSFKWLLERHSKATLETLEHLELRFGHCVSEPPGPFDFTLSGSSSIKGSFRFGGPRDYCQVVTCIAEARPLSLTRLSFISLNLGPFIHELLCNDGFTDQLRRLSPITHLELEQEFGYIETNPVFRIFRGMDPIKALVQAAIEPPLSSNTIAVETHWRTLERVAIYTKDSWFGETEILVEALREEHRIAQ